MLLEQQKLSYKKKKIKHKNAKNLFITTKNKNLIRRIINNYLNV